MTYAIKRIKSRCADELRTLGRRLRTPRPPFRKITHGEAVELLLEKGCGVKQGEEIPLGGGGRAVGELRGFLLADRLPEDGAWVL